MFNLFCEEVRIHESSRDNGQTLLEPGLLLMRDPVTECFVPFAMRGWSVDGRVVTPILGGNPDAILVRHCQLADQNGVARSAKAHVFRLDVIHITDGVLHNSKGEPVRPNFWNWISESEIQNR